jgi:hypothetical protein
LSKEVILEYKRSNIRGVYYSSGSNIRGVYYSSGSNIGGIIIVLAEAILEVKSIFWKQY